MKANPGRQAVLVLLAFTLAASAQTPQEKEPLDPESFVRKAVQINLGEIEVGTLAAKQSMREEVQRYGLSLAEDQRKVARELLSMAAANEWKIPEAPDRRHHALTVRLAELKGPAFDRLFLAEMVRSHQEMLQLFEAQAQRGKDAQVQRYARKMLPVLRAHLEKAQALADSPGSSAPR